MSEPTDQNELTQAVESARPTQEDRALQFGELTPEQMLTIASDEAHRRAAARFSPAQRRLLAGPWFEIRTTVVASSFQEHASLSPLRVTLGSPGLAIGAKVPKPTFRALEERGLFETVEQTRKRYADRHQSNPLDNPYHSFPDTPVMFSDRGELLGAAVLVIQQGTLQARKYFEARARYNERRRETLRERSNRQSSNVSTLEELRAQLRDLPELDERTREEILGECERQVQRTLTDDIALAHPQVELGDLLKLVLAARAAEPR